MRIRNHKRHCRNRRGLTTTELLLVLGGIVIAALVGFQLLGGAANTRLNQTSGGIADPSQLPSSFGP